MKLFGRYLVDEGIITEEILLKGLVEQTRAMPSVTEIVFEHEIYNISDQLEIMEHQSCSKCSFIESAKALGKWTQDVEDRILKLLQEVRQPLGQIFVKMGAVNFNKLTGALDDFMVEFEDEIRAVQETGTAQVPAKADTESQVEAAEPVAAEPVAAEPVAAEPFEAQVSEISPVGVLPTEESRELRATDLDFGFSKIDESMVESYQSLMTAADRANFDDQIKLLSSDINEFMTGSQNFIDSVSESKAGARFVQAELSVYMYTLFEELAVAICNGPGVFSVDDIGEIRDLMASLLEEIWNLKLTMTSLYCELPYWETPNSRNRFLTLHDRFMEKIASYSGVPLQKAS